MSSPYEGLAARQFWKHGVGQHTTETVADLYTPKWPIHGLRIATAGSCFAQEIAKALRLRNYPVLDVEPAPAGTHPTTAAKYGYGLYSARHGNIYSSRHLLQLTKEALGVVHIPSDVLVFQKDSRFYDSMRPSVEPNGLNSISEVVSQREDHLRRFRLLLEQCDLFVFTLGLTESWIDRESGLVFQSAPGENYNPSLHDFRNWRFAEITDDMKQFMQLARTVSSSMKFLLTVSPVPLTATYENQHVLVSTVRSKSVLRAVAAELSETIPYVDYFPSYELLSTAYLGPDMFQSNRRNVRSEGVAAVMSAFFAAHEQLETDSPRSLTTAVPTQSPETTQCEDALLEGFAP